MKKIFTLCLFGLLVLNVHAQDWNFSSYSSEEDFSEDITSNYDFNGLTLYATTDKKFTMQSNSKTLDDVDYTIRLKTNGTSKWDSDDVTPIGRIAGFSVSGNTTITVYAMSSSSSATDRYVNVCSIANGTRTELFSGNVTSSLAAYSGKYTGGASTIYVYCTVGAINMYRIVAESTSTSIGDNVEYTGEVISTEYYNLSGAMVGNDVERLSTGVYIKKATYSDGKVKTSKISIFK